MIFKKYLNKLNNLPRFCYNKKILIYKDINAFIVSSKKDNDKNNKTRENIIGAIINNKIPNEYYKYSRRWNNLKKSIEQYIYDLIGIHTNINSIALKVLQYISTSRVIIKILVLLIPIIIVIFCFSIMKKEI